MAPKISSGSRPAATAAGSAASIGSCDQSSSHANTRMKARRFPVSCSRIVPASIG